MSNVIMCSECKTCNGDRCNYFDNDSDRESTIACILFEPKNPTVFNRITADEEVLAKKLVFLECIDRMWHSTIFPYPENPYPTREEAIAATVAKLKEATE